MADEGRPDDHAAALAAAARLHAAGDDAGALDILPGLVTARPDDLAVRLLLARCLGIVGAPAVARAAAEAAVECDPTSWQAHVLVARAVRDTDGDAAVAAAERAVALAPAEPEVHRALAEATAAQGGATVAALIDPSLLDGPRPDPLERDRTLTPTLPKALIGVAPELDPAPDAPSPPSAATSPAAAWPTPSEAMATRAGDEPRRERLQPVLPVALGGTGLGAGLLDAPNEEPDTISTKRLAFRIVGLVGWLLLGFRLLFQGVGGPVGTLLFALVVLGVALGSRRVTKP